MKHRYLLNHVLSHIHSIARLYDAQLHLTETVTVREGFDDWHFAERITGHALIRNYVPSKTPPLIFKVNDAQVYAWVPIGSEYCLLGPTRLMEEARFRYQIALPPTDAEDSEAVSAWINTIPYCSIGVFAEDVLLLYHIEADAPKEPPLGVRELISANIAYQQVQRRALREFYTAVFENVEKGFAHNPYNHEARECAAIRRGDVEGLRRILEERYPGRHGKLSEDPVRSMINLGIVAITLASRAAIEGGLHYETAFYMSDIFIQQLEACHDVVTIDILYHNAQIHYAELVHELLTRRDHGLEEIENPHVSHCKDYVFAHLHSNLKVREIAEAIGLETNYLSALFARCEHISLKQFILNEKIKLCKNLLAYSDYSYIQIAASLGFSSQSHMGKEFRKVTGTTPRAYRLANREDDFVRQSMELDAKN